MPMSRGKGVGRVRQVENNAVAANRYSTKHSYQLLHPVIYIPGECWQYMYTGYGEV